MTNTRIFVLSLFFIAATLVQADDWANLGRYNDSDNQLALLPPGTNQVIFMGDSITQFWNVSLYFPNKPYVNRGIHGQITAQMLARFREDVINLQPNVVVILAGINDLNKAQYYHTDSEIEGNIMSMTEIALANNVSVILSSLLPVCGKPATRIPNSKIMNINSFLESYSQKAGVLYLDYFSSLVGSDGMRRPELSIDCLHPNAAGYSIMAPLAEAAIKKALGKHLIIE